MSKKRLQKFENMIQESIWMCDKRAKSFQKALERIIDLAKDQEKRIIFLEQTLKYPSAGEGNPLPEQTHK